MSRRSAAAVHFLAPGPLDTLTGGFVYDRHMVAALAAAGRLGGVHELLGTFPRAAPYDIAAGAAVLAGLPDRAVAVVDGLCLTALGQAVALHAARLSIVALIHHPLADETGLSERERMAFLAAEKAVLAEVDRVIVTSRPTAKRLLDFAVEPARVHVVEPGTATWAKPLPHRPVGAPLRLLSVGTLVPRKGHDLVLRALAGLDDVAWRLDIAGGRRDPAHAAELEAMARDLGLSDRVAFLGEVAEADLARLHAEADLFVLATRYEGYGMALADAAAAGLPIVTSEAGTIPEGVARGGAVVVPTGDVAALAAALARLLRDPGRIAELAERARAALVAPRDWQAAGRAFLRAVDGVVLQ